MKSKIKTLSDLFVIFFSIAFAINFISLSRNGVINGYPYVSPDGFDWYAEGIYLYTSLFKILEFPLQVLRPPIFVIFCGIDYLFGGAGYIIGGIYGINIIVFYKFICKFIKLVNKKVSDSLIYPSVALSCTILPINFIRPYLLADEIAITLSMLSAYFAYRGIREKSLKNYAMGGFICFLGGLTQTYAMLPFLCIFFVYISTNFFKNINFNRYIFLYTFITLAGYLSFIYKWRNFLPHLSTPNNFNLLAFDLKMLMFYISAWSIFFFEFFAFKLIAVNFKIRNDIIYKNIDLLFLTILLAILSLFYHWPESRFIAYYWHFILIIFLIGIELESYEKYLFLAMMACSIFIVPLNYWAPTWDSTNYGLKNNWTYKYFTEISDIRGINDCNQIDCSANIFLKNSDDYVKNSVELYIKLNNLNERERVSILKNL